MGAIRRRINFQAWELDFIRLAYPLSKAKCIALILERSTGTIKYAIQQMGLLKLSHRIQIGDRFGKLVVLELLEHQSKGLLWLCRCDCGKKMKALSNTLLSTHSRSCGCGRIETISSGYGSISGTWYGACKRNAGVRGLKFEVSFQFLDALFKKQNGKCAISGIQINIVQGRQTRETTASLDRIDPDFGYIENNVQFVHKHINYMKWKHNQEYFLKLCKTITRYQEKQDAKSNSNSNASSIEKSK